jgi:hypothetical protein
MIRNSKLGISNGIENQVYEICVQRQRSTSDVYNNRIRRQEGTLYFVYYLQVFHTFKDMSIDLDIASNFETSINIVGKTGSFSLAQLDATKTYVSSKLQTAHTTALSVAIGITTIGVERKLPDKSNHFAISMHLSDPRFPTYIEDGQQLV